MLFEVVYVGLKKLVVRVSFGLLHHDLRKYSGIPPTFLAALQYLRCSIVGRRITSP